MIFLILGGVNGDNTNKIELLFHKYRSVMHYIAHGVLHDKALVDDAVSESFERVVKNIEKIGEVSCPRTRNLIVIITKHVSLNILKKKRDIPYEDIESIAAPVFGVEDCVISMEACDEIAEIVDSLREDYKTVIELSLFHGFTNAEIAEITGLKYETVKKRVYRAKLEIRAKLSKLMETR